MASSMLYSLSRSRSDQCPSTTVSSSTLTETETIAEHVRGGGDASSSCHHPCHHHDGAIGVDREDYARMSHPRLLNTVKLSSVVRLLEQVGDSVTG